MEIEFGANTVTDYLELILLSYFFHSSISLEIHPLSGVSHRWMRISDLSQPRFWSEIVETVGF